MNRPVHFVLNRLKKLRTLCVFWVIIDACSINIKHLCPKYFFATSYISYAREQLFKVVALPTVFKQLIIHRKAFYDVLLEPCRRPLAELCTLERFYSIANGDDDIEVVEVCRLLSKFGISEFLHRNYFFKLFFLINILDMFIYSRTAFLKKLCHLLLS